MITFLAYLAIAQQILVIATRYHFFNILDRAIEDINSVTQQQLISVKRYLIFVLIATVFCIPILPLVLISSLSFGFDSTQMLAAVIFGAIMLFFLIANAFLVFMPLKQKMQQLMKSDK